MSKFEPITHLGVRLATHEELKESENVDPANSNRPENAATLEAKLGPQRPPVAPKPDLDIEAIRQAERDAGFREGAKLAERLLSSAAPFMSPALVQPAFTPAPVPAITQAEPETRYDHNRPSMLLSEVSKAFLEAQQNSESTNSSYSKVFKDLISLFGDIPASKIRFTDLDGYLKSLSEEMKVEGGPKHATVVKKYSHLKGFFAWALDNEYSEINPAEKIRKPKKPQGVTHADSEERDPFYISELKTLFSSPLFTGCMSLHRRSAAGKVIARDDKYYFLLCLFLTGARVSELANAPATLRFTKDIQHEGKQGVLCLDLLGATKTGQSPRLVPILPDLEKTGFIEFANEKARKGLPLFSQMDWSKWANRYIDAQKLTRDNTCAYSLRHNFRQIIRNVLSPETANLIFGHSDKVTAELYGKGLTNREAEAFCSNVKPAIDIDHLYV